MIQSGNTVALLGKQGQLYVIGPNIRQVFCRPLDKIWSTTDNGCFVGLTMSGSYVLITPNEIVSIDEKVKSLGEFVVQDNIIWSQKQKYFKGYSYANGKWNTIIEHCDTVLSVHAHGLNGLIITNNKWITYGCFRAEYQSLYIPVKHYHASYMGHHIVLENSQAVLIESQSIRLLSSDAVNWVSDLEYVDVNGQEIWRTGDVIAKHDTKVSFALYTNKALFLAHDNYVVCQTDSLAFHSPIYKLFPYDSDFFVVLKDLSVRFGTVSENKLCLIDETFFVDRPLGKKNFE